MQSPDGTVVFVEVRKRSRSDFGGAAATIGPVKQRRIIFAARHYLLSWRQLPPARFDVVTLEGQGLQWLQAAFDAS
jgi:putative endonuclease